MMLEKIDIAVEKLKATKPLVLNITNYVSMDFMANALLAIGAAPLMTVCDDELEELIGISSSINMNLGTLDEALIQRCTKVVTLAKKYQKPIVLDPVGAGASLIRTQTATQLMKDVNIVRGNASEIMSLAKHHCKTLGVESTHTTKEAKESAVELAKRHKFTVVVSGAVDFISDGKREAEIPFGSSLMSQVTGMGCTLTAIIAAFRSVVEDSFECSQIATAYFGLCGQLAAKKAQQPGRFRTAFIDSLYTGEK